MTNEEQIVSFLKGREEATPKEIAEGTGIASSIVRQLVGAMMHKGTIERLGFGRYSMPTEADQPDDPPGILESLLAAAPVAMSMLTLDSRYILATDAYIKGLRLEKHAPLAGKHILDVFDNPSASAGEYIRAAEAGECPSLHTPERFTVNGGDVVYMTYATDNWHRQDGTRGGYFITCFFGKTPDEVERARELTYNGMGQISIVAEGESLDIMREKPQWMTIHKSGGEVDRFSDSDIRALVERIITSLIEWEAVDMLVERIGGQPFEAAALKLIRSRQGRLYEVTFSAQVKLIEPGKSLDDSAPNDEAPPSEEGRA